MLSRILPLATVATFAVCAPASAAAPVVALPGGAMDLAVGPDGSPRVALAYSSRDSDAAVKTFAPSLASSTTQDVLPSSGKRGLSSPVLTPGGVVVAYTWQEKAKSQPVLQVVSATSGSAPFTASAPQTISNPGAFVQAGLPPVVGPTGAVALEFSQGSVKSPIEQLAFRPVGAAAFGPAVPLGTARESRLTSFEEELGPDGGGFLIATPQRALKTEPYVRRISPDGTLGPRIPTGFGVHDGAVLAAAVGPTGTLVLAASISDFLKGGGQRTTLNATSLAPGSTAPTPVVSLGETEFAAFDRGNLSLTVGADDRTVLVAGVSKRRLEIFEGTGAQLTKTGALKAQLPFGARAFLATDGAVSVVWSDLKAAAKPLTGKPVIRTARKSAGGTFSAPHIALKFPGAEDVALSFAKALPDGRIAVVVDRLDLETPGDLPSRLSIVQP